MVAFEKPRKCRSAETLGMVVMREGGAALSSTRKISSQYRHRLVTIRTSRDADRNLPLRSTAMVLGLPEGMPISSITVFQLPVASFTWMYGKVRYLRSEGVV